MENSQDEFFRNKRRHFISYFVNEKCAQKIRNNNEIPVTKFVAYFCVVLHKNIFSIWLDFLIYIQSFQLFSKTNEKEQYFNCTLKYKEAE